MENQDVNKFEESIIAFKTANKGGKKAAADAKKVEGM